MTNGQEYAKQATPEPAIAALLNERIAAGDFPSAVYTISENGNIRFADALGNAVVEPSVIPASLDTIYDLASLTKPLVTGLLCARRIELGELTLDSSVSHYLPEFDRTDKQMITVRELLTHTSGLPAWRPLYMLTEGDPERAASVIADEALEYRPGTRVVYSDLGFISLGFLLERMMGESLAGLAQEEIFAPLGLERTFFRPEQALQTGIAACETGNLYEAQTVRESGIGEYNQWREQIIWGEVHDGNAYFLGGSAGHAGLFSNALETNRLAEQCLEHSSAFLSPETCQLFRENMTNNLDEARSIAWQLAATRDSAAGPDLPPDSFGHSGFTGTSCWVDGRNERVFVLLTNRTHARTLPFVNINAVRRKFHSLAALALEL